MKKRILNIEGMTCSACSSSLEKYLNKQDGIELASVNLVMSQAHIEYDEKKLRYSDLDRFVKEAGFKSSGDEVSSVSRKNFRKSLIVFSILSVFLMYISMGEMINLPIPGILNKMIHPIIFSTTEMVITILFIIWGLDIVKNGIKNILYKMPNMDSLAGIGVIINFVYSFYNTIMIYKGNHYLVNNLYFEASGMIILFIKIGRYIDRTNKAKAVDLIKNLVMITPKTGIILKNGIENLVTINEIKKGDIVVSKPGEKIAVDGIVLKGETHTDESFITGESSPVSKKEGDKVLAGSINYEGYIEYAAENIGKDSQVSHIVDLVVEATTTKAPIARLADKISSYFVPAIFIISVIAFLLNLMLGREIGECINSLVTVLVIACPCSLGLATPLAMVVSIGNASRNGIIIKSSESLETINNIDTVVFDKTGTLTKGEMEVVDLKFVEGHKEEYLNILQSLEAKSTHPLAKGICKSRIDLFVLQEVEDFEEIAGQGVIGKVQGINYFAGNRKLFESRGIRNVFEKEEKEFSSKGESIIYFGSDFGMFGIVGLRDNIKPTTKTIVSELKGINKKVIMLSGDNAKTSKIIADEIGIDEVYSEATPKEKLDKIQELNQNVLMVGDGINDSPSLKTATIGVSVSNGTDISYDSSDIILLSDGLKKIYYLFKLGKKSIKIIKENLFWSLFYNVVLIPIAMGLFQLKINPMFVSLAMMFSSLTVVFNSLRLKKIDK